MRLLLWEAGVCGTPWELWDTNRGSSPQEGAMAGVVTHAQLHLRADL